MTRSSSSERSEDIFGLAGGGGGMDLMDEESREREEIEDDETGEGENEVKGGEFLWLTREKEEEEDENEEALDWSKGEGDSGGSMLRGRSWIDTLVMGLLGGVKGE